MKTFQFNKELLDQYQEALNIVIECGADSAMIAGGAVRDMLLGKEIADVDIFYTGELDLEKLVTKMPVLKAKNPKLNFEDFGYEDFASEWNVKFHQLKYKNLPPVQLIEIKEGDIFDHLAKFGAGISKVAMLADGTFWFTPEFMKDVMEECIHFDPNCGDAYKEKIANKFPEYLALEEVNY